MKTSTIIAAVVVVVVVAVVAAVLLSMHPSTTSTATSSASSTMQTTTSTMQTSTQSSSSTTSSSSSSMQSSSSSSMAPELIPVSSATINVTASMGGTVRLGNIIAIIRPGTNVTVNGETLTSYSFSIIDYKVVDVGLPSSMMGDPASMGMYQAEPIYAFAYAVNGHVSPAYTFSQPIITVVRMPDGWTSWTWLGYTQESNGTLVGGSYKFPNAYFYAGSGLFVNVQFVKPVPWIFISGAPLSMNEATYSPEVPVNSSLMSSMAPVLVPVGSATVQVNATQGAAVSIGNLLAIIMPGTYVEQGGQMMSQYNFSLVYQAIYNVPPLNASTAGWPLFAYSFAVNGHISPAYTFVNSNGKPTPVITVAFLPPTFWTWTWLGYTQEPDGVLIGGSYKFPNVWLPGDDYIVNVQFVKPVPWIFLGGETGITGQSMPMQSSTMTSSTMPSTTTTSTSTSTTTTSSYVWGG
ncbi:hypothetical protein [Thermocladium modestius]|nr:hypothetical protein [Thermocladium modestius]